MIQCPVCRISYVNNTLFCNECGLYLPQRNGIGTDPFDTSEADWLGDAKAGRHRKSDMPESGPLSVILHIGSPGQSGGNRLPNPPARGRGIGARVGRNGHYRHKAPAGELEVPLTRPVRLGRMDPSQNIYPEVDLTEYLALECGVSREHACISRRGGVVEVEDMASTNGTLLNGERLAPYLAVPLLDGDQLQLGKLLIEVRLKGHYEPSAPLAKYVFQPAAT
jgi:hypothetical protein